MAKYKRKESLAATKLRYEKLINSILDNLKQDEVAVFTDGSFDRTNYVGGYGIVVLLYHKITKQKTMLKYKKSFYNHRQSHREILKYHNVGTECEAIKDIVQTAINKNIKKIIIFHDYEGISKWANFEWKAQNNYTDDYVRTLNKYKKQIEIQFVKIPSHKGIIFNEMADNLAKEALTKAIALNKKYK